MKKLCLLACLAFLFNSLSAQICGTPGLDGPRIVKDGDSFALFNTYYPPAKDIVLHAGEKSVMLAAVPPPGSLGTLKYGEIPIKKEDLLLIIQMQDATINYSNDATYGAGSAVSGSDGLGGTGYTDLGNTGKYEYVIATNEVPLTGGLLTFRAAGIGNGVVNTYTNTEHTAVRGKRTFQVIRIPQYAMLDLGSDIKTPHFNGRAGGVLALSIAGKFFLSKNSTNGVQIEGSARGFDGGYTAGYTADYNIKNLYAIPHDDTRATTKGEGIAGTPSSIIDFYMLRESNDTHYPGGDNGRGAPGNAGGGGKGDRAGGGGGGNGGAGGMGATDPPKDAPNGGRPGSAVYRSGITDIERLIFGGGGGAGGANYMEKLYGGMGGSIMLINAGSITGKGQLLASGQSASGGGGGAGGTVFINVKYPDPSANIMIDALGGNSGGMNAGGGGGQVFHNLLPGTVTVDVKGGKNLTVDDPERKGANGQAGNVATFGSAAFPPQQRTGCYPELSVSMRQIDASTPRFPGNEVSYELKITNPALSGGASGVQADVLLPQGFAFVSASAAYTGYATGPAVLISQGTDAGRPLLGDFHIPQGEEVTIIIKAGITCNVVAGVHHASAQALYFDPSRTDSLRRIKAAVNAFADAGTPYPTTYETGPSGPVAGMNYDGNLASATAEDVTVKFPIIKSNKINNPAATGPFCKSYNPPLITGQEAEVDNGAFSYQWESSLDGITYTEIAGATARDYDPDVINDTTYYRRQVAQNDCSVTSSPSNVVRIDVNPAITLDFEVPALCVMDGVAKFTNKTLNSAGNTTGLTYLWNFGDAGGSTAVNPNTSSSRDGSHTYTTAGIYTVTLVVTKDGYCEQSPLPRQVLISSVPVAGYEINPTTLCSGGEVTFKDKSTIEFGELSKIEWHFDDLDPTAVFIDNAPAKRNEAAVPRKYVYPEFHDQAVKIVNGRILVYSGTACVAEKPFSITLKATPELVFEAPEPICLNAKPFKLSAGRETGGAVTGTGKYSGPGIQADGETFDPKAAGPGSHELVYNFTPDGDACPRHITGIVRVLDALIFSAGKDLGILKGGSAKLMATGSSDLSYKWSPATYLDHDDIQTPTVTPLSDISYTLTVKSITSGCTDSAKVSVTVLLKPEIPNTFSPNGDGVNDTWNIKYLEGYEQATINIFSRNGEKVFSSVGYQKSWDGKFEGHDVAIGTYYYVIDPGKGIKVLSGSLTVLR